MYKGNADALSGPITRLTDDEELQGVLFYIAVTGKRVAEFVVRTSLVLPSQPYPLPPNAYLWACPVPTGTTSGIQNVLVYDGWMELPDIAPEGIRVSIDQLRYSLHRLAFAFQGSITWRLKYLPSHHARGLHQPSNEEFHSLEWLLEPIPNQNEAALLDAAIDWYNAGSTSPNPLTEFLCYFIAMESLSIAITDGNATFGLSTDALSPGEIRKERIACIDALSTEMLTSDPIGFVTKAYFECVLSLSRRLRAVLELTFGNGHPYIDLIFSKSSSRPSLAEIRSKLAHGRLTLLSPEDDRLVRANTFRMASVAHEFILRLCASSLPSRPTGPYGWSGQHSLSMSMADPRTIFVLSDMRVLPPSDWKIRPEWCDP
jgi:hypothetical protein